MKPQTARDGLRRGLPVYLLIFSALIAVAASGEDRPAGRDKKPLPDAFDQNKRLGRGVNILGYDPIWKSRSNGRFQAEHFRLIHNAGFRHVRINLQPFRDARPNGRLSDDYWRTLDWAVQNATDAGLAVILDCHEYETLAHDPLAKKERFLDFWRQVAERYKNAPGTVYFEILNEPNGELTPKLWNQFLRDALAVIRRTNPERTVIVGPGQWNNIDKLGELDLPTDDRHLIVTVHYYSPFEFTHQGAPWVGRQDKVGIAWNGTASERNAISSDFARAQAWAKKHNRPIYLGEFGAYDKAAMSSRVRYLDGVARQAERMGWSWAYWQFDSDFIVYDIPNHRWNKPILEALIPPAGS